jgi:hypothetical protein
MAGDGAPLGPEASNDVLILAPFGLTAMPDIKFIVHCKIEAGGPVPLSLMDKTR